MITRTTRHKIAKGLEFCEAEDLCDGRQMEVWYKYATSGK